MVDGRPETPVEFFKRVIVEQGGSLSSLSEADRPETLGVGGKLELGRAYNEWSLRNLAFDYCQSIGGTGLGPEGACVSRDGHGLFLLRAETVLVLGPNWVQVSMVEPKGQPSPFFERLIASYKHKTEVEDKAYATRARAKQEAADAARQSSLDLYATVSIGTLLCADIQSGLNKGKLKAYLEARQDGNYRLRLAEVDGIRESDRYRYQDSQGNTVWLTIGEVFWEPPLGWLPCNQP